MSMGALDCGFADFSATAATPEPKLNKAPLPTAIAFVIALSDAIIDEIADAPTHSYFHHYRTVNYRIDQMLLSLGFLLAQNGFRYIPIPASQSIPTNELPFSGRFPHKAAAVAAGLGDIGRNCLFLHRTAGCRVRLGTMFTDWLPASFPTSTEGLRLSAQCADCTKCVDACPARALIGLNSTAANRDNLLIPERCSQHMKSAYRDIGRGSVCGICMRVCPAGRR